MARSLTNVMLKSMRRLVNQQQKQASKAVTMAVKSVFGAPPKPPRNRKVAAPKKAVPRKTSLAFAPLLTAAQAARAAPARPTARRTPAAKPRPIVKPGAADAFAHTPLYTRPERGSWTRGVFEPQEDAVGSHGGMHYWLYWPINAPDTPRPLVVMLHGCGQTATEFAQGTRMNELAQRKGFAVLYPQQSVMSDPNRCWPWYTQENQRGGGDAGTIRDLILQTLRDHRVDRRRVYLAGISAGAAMAQIIALSDPDLVAAVGLHSAPVFGTADSAASAFGVMQHGDATGFERALRPVTRTAAGPIEIPAILIHGDADKVVRPVNLMQVARQFALLNGLKGESAHPLLRDYPARVRGVNPRHEYRTLSYLVDGKPRLVACQVTGLEHAWSGGVGGLRFNSAAGPDASLMIWNFFARHRSNGARPDARAALQEVPA